MFLSVSMPGNDPVKTPNADAVLDSAPPGHGNADATGLAGLAETFASLGATLRGEEADERDGLEIVIPTASLFIDDTATIRAQAIALFDRVAAALASAGGQRRLVLQAGIGSGLNVDHHTTKLAFRRAAAIGGVMLRHGSPSSSFSVGANQFADDVVRLRFRFIGKNDVLDAAF
ncbi:MAG: hypothetical protein HC834_01410 [Rhodospirillales bacterium]|nr:hypothetical protein [Rhodospirillales bacterium]